MPNLAYGWAPVIGMSYSGISRMLSHDRLDVSLAKIGLVAAVLLLSLNLVTTQVFLVVIPAAMGLGSLLYLVTQTSREETVVGTSTPTSSVATPTVSGSIVGYLPALVMLGLAGLVVYTFQTGVRTDAIYLLTGVIGTAIFVQILVAERGHIAPGLILFQILIAAVLIRLTALWVTPGYVGVDIWTHGPVWVSGIAERGDLTVLAGSKYLMAPFYHVVGAIGTLALGSVRHGIYLTLGLIVPLSAVLVYSTGRLLVPARWALLATALFAFSDQAIRWGMHLIPTSLGLVFALAMMYAITRLFVADAERWVVVLLLASSLALVFTHQVSTTIGLVILGVATFTAGVTVVTGRDSTPSGGVRETVALGGVFIVTLVTTIAIWSMTPFTRGQSFLWGELAVLQQLIMSEAGFLNLAGGSGADRTLSGATTSGSLLADIVPYIDVFGFGVLLLATIIGGLYMVHWTDAPALTTTHLLVGGTLFVFVFGLSIFGIRALLPGRWIAFLYISMALLGAVGMYHLSQHGSRGLVVAVFLLVAVGYPTTMVVAEKATLESPAFEDQYVRFAHTESEIAAVETIRVIHPPDGTRTIGTDQPYQELFVRYGGYGRDADTLVLGTNGPVGDAVVYRRYQSTGPVTFDRAESASGIAFPTNVESSVCPAGWNVVYVNDDVKFCTAPEGGS